MNSHNHGKMVKVNEDFLDSLLLTAMPELEKALKDEPLTFEPNPNLGEGNASDRNLEYRQTLLTLLKDTVYDPMTGLLNSDKTVEEKIKAVDGYIEDYIYSGKSLVEEYLTKSYMDSAEEATIKLKEAAKQQDAEYGPNIPDKPDKLLQIILMGQHNIEDYGLTLRGRLRSAIETKAWMNNYASSKA
jgi:hypothetical protein